MVNPMSGHLYNIKGALRPRKFTVSLIKTKLGAFGLRGEMLRKETARILAGPTDGVTGSYPFGWTQEHFDHRMKRIFIRAGYASIISDNESRPLRRRSTITISKKYLSI